MNFTKVIFGVGSRFPETSALSLWLITVKQSVALHLEVRFIDESDFLNNRKGFIVKDNPNWEIDSSISLDLADSLDDIADFEQELKSTESDSVSEISSSRATRDDSDGSDYGEGTSATKSCERKKLTAKYINRGKEMIIAHNNQSSQPSIDLNSSQSSAATSTRIEQKHQQESKLRRTESKSENNKDANN